MTKELGKSTEEDLIKQRLFVSEDDMTQKLDSLLQRVERHIQIESATGAVILMQTNLQIKPALWFHLMGHYFYVRANGQNDPSLSISSLSDSVGKAITSLSGPLAELVQDGYVKKVGTGKYQIAYYKIEDFLNGFERNSVSDKKPK